MTLDQVIDTLKREKQQEIPSRFPCRAIMVKDVRQYGELLARLNSIPDIAVASSDELFSSNDVMPAYENLTDQKYADRWLVLPGVSEYLRLFHKNEASSQRFAKLWGHQKAAVSRGRIIIPLWGCEALWHDHALHLCDDTRQDGFYYDCVDHDADEQQLHVTILSGEFEEHLGALEGLGGQVFIGLREWYEYWADVRATELPCDQVLLTRRYASVQPTTGAITVRVIRNGYDFIKESLRNADALTQRNCPKEAQTLLLDSAIRGRELKDAILLILNVTVFSGTDIMSRWETMSIGEKQLVALWLQLYPDESYLCHCVRVSSDLEELQGHILLDILSLYASHPNWIEESQALSLAMGLERDVAYLSALDKIPVYDERLQFLTGKSKSERIYLLRLVGKWMREDPEQIRQSERLRHVFPQLFAYLNRDTYDTELAGYFSLYKSHKLENTLPRDEDQHFSGLNTERYDYRYAKVSTAVTDDCVILWIDALGAEWLPLLVWALRKSKKGSVKEYSVAQASLPTETTFNEQWKQMPVDYKKLNRLDKLAHKGIIDDPDYYACIEDQMSFIVDLQQQADELLTQYDRVIITGDHGTSRLAARIFHKRDGIPAPTEATVFSHGRYCEIPAGVTLAQPDIVYVNGSDGTRYAVFGNYDHFIRGGFAAGADDEKAIYGEIHGGATPEEMLVPVVVFDSNVRRPLTASWEFATVKIMSRRAKAQLTFNRPVSSLQVKVGSIEAECSPMENKKAWNVLIKGIAAKKHSVSVYADGNLIPVDPLEILPALGGGEGDLP